MIGQKLESDDIIIEEIAPDTCDWAPCPEQSSDRFFRVTFKQPYRVLTLCSHHMSLFMLQGSARK